MGRMRGYARASVAGNVGNVNFSQTDRGDPVVTFDVCCEDNRHRKTWIKVVSYDGMARIAQEKGLKRGDYVVVGLGKLTNRILRGVQTCELRTEEFLIFPQQETKNE